MNVEQLQKSMAQLEIMLATTIAELNKISKSVCDSCCVNEPTNKPFSASQDGEVKDVAPDVASNAISQAKEALGAVNVNDDKSKKLYNWAKSRGMNDEKWKGACFSVGVKKSTGMSDQQYVALRREVLATIGIS